jgi:hypothetical protein
MVPFIGTHDTNGSKSGFLILSEEDYEALKSIEVNFADLTGFKRFHIDGETILYIRLE